MGRQPISKVGSLLSLIVAGSLVIFALQLFIKVFQVSPDPYNPLPSERSLAVFVLSYRYAFDRRQTIRNTWAFGHKNVFFVVGEQFCPYPPENRIPKTCIQNNYSLTSPRFKPYLYKEEMITRKLLDEPDVILVPTGDYISELPRQVTESYRWALKNLRAEWFLHVEDTLDVEVDMFEHYLKTTFENSRKNVIISSVKGSFAMDIKNKSVSLGKFMCGANLAVSRCIAQYTVGGSSPLFEFIREHNYSEIRLANSLNITLERYRNLNFIAKDGCRMTTTLQFGVSLRHNQTKNCLHSNSVETPTSQGKGGTTYTLFENPSTYLHSRRFDLIVKMLYAHFYAFKNRVPKMIKNAYIEHEKVWNNFKENCHQLNKDWYDANRPCVDKRGSSDFISAFHYTINTIRKFGFNASMSRIPVDKTGFLLNGAHRIAASVVLSKYATFEHHIYEKSWNWGYKFFKGVGLSESMSNFIMLEWLKLQMKLPYLKTLVSIVSVFSNNHRKDVTMRKIVKKMCSKDNGILYETSVKVTIYGARQLITHMYGKQFWLEAKIKDMRSKFESSTYSVLFLFVYGKGEDNLVQCKHEIRQLYNDTIFKSSAHIPDTAEENLILAEMILNPNSLQFMNHANDAADCKHIAGEIATRSLTPPIETLPQMYVGNDGIMVDSGAVLGFFGLRKRTDVGILFLHDVDKTILGDHHGLNIQAHAFKFNSISNERPWGEDHFSKKRPIDQWDLFYDPENYGYCYGIKFVSLQQLIRYKIKRNEADRDQYDVRLINEFLENVAL